VKLSIGSAHLTDTTVSASEWGGSGQRDMPKNSQAVKRAFDVLGVRVDAVQIPNVVEQMKDWIANGQVYYYIAFTGLHGISEANRDPQFKYIVNRADMVVADGMPLVWLGRFHGHSLRRRVYGPELLETFCRETGSQYRHFFYGGAPGVAEGLATSLRERFHIDVAGTYSPPFRDLTEEEDRALVDRVHEAAPDVLWVGLSTPKQERWMYEHLNRLRVPVLLGVGAAFDLNSGSLRQAPEWMRENGLEWLFRLLVEPRRLWKRYLVTIPSAVWSISLEIIQLRKPE
jgi:N-acetylglucosaminyldiphosphoundecaprenol N-acetyl-beta-D-mannosaminyltransferase